jgi:hypothetical protein
VGRTPGSPLGPAPDPLVGPPQAPTPPDASRRPAPVVQRSSSPASSPAANASRPPLPAAVLSPAPRPRCLSHANTPLRRPVASGSSRSRNSTITRASNTPLRRPVASGSSRLRNSTITRASATI